MAQIQRLKTGRSSQFADSAGSNMADSMLLKSFFAEQGLLPADIDFESLFTFPATDFENSTGGSVVTSMSRVLLTTPNNNALNLGWDMGAAKSKVLAIVGMVRPKTGGMGIFISPNLPATNGTRSAYQLQLDCANGRILLNRYDAGGAETTLITQANIGPVNGVTGPSIALALYYDDATDRLVGFMRIGSECWFPVIDTTDATFTTMRYVAISCGSAGTPSMWAGCPVAIYNE